jgi:diadenylate cyclase
MTFLNDTMEYLNSFVTYMGTIEWQDYTEIVIIAVLLYYMIKWIHQSRAWSLLKGLLVIVIFIGLAKIFHMDTILWLASNILQFAVIALIVVLQPELRKALESLGKTNVIGGMFDFGQKPAEEILSRQSINEIVRACSQMGRVRTGALIVIENKESVSRIDETGIKVDADITSQLLINIFEKNTPLHDGAVTVRNNRISAATCYLPLTQSQTISKELGTRHRAGLGMSEEYDAVIIIVSEETGRISAAHEGQLERNLSEEALRNYIITELGLLTEEGKEDTSKKRRRRK